METENKKSGRTELTTVEKIKETTGQVPKENAIKNGLTYHCPFN